MLFSLAARYPQFDPQETPTPEDDLAFRMLKVALEHRYDLQ